VTSAPGQDSKAPAPERQLALFLEPDGQGRVMMHLHGVGVLLGEVHDGATGIVVNLGAYEDGASFHYSKLVGQPY